jgi:adenylate cyclase
VKLPFVARPRLQHRIVLFFVALLVIVQLASFYFIRYAIEQIAQVTLREELQVGARVFQRLLEQNSQQLVEATSVLTYDHGFREAVATRDRDTILSALNNHAARIKASGMAVVGLDGKVVADTLDEANAGGAYSYPDLVAKARRQGGRTSAIRLRGDTQYQVVVVPVLAPLPIAWVAMSFVIDDKAALDLQRLTLSDVTFVHADSDMAVILATTLPEKKRAALVVASPHILAVAREGAVMPIGGEDYVVLATPLEDAGGLRLFAILQRSVAEGVAPYLTLQVVLLVLALISVMVTLAGGIRIARRITRPVEELAAAAREVARGNYEVATVRGGPDEIGELARDFDSMVQGLAERDAMRDALGKVASSEVVQQLLRGQIELGGEERDVSVMFADIRNFTPLCEELSPQQSLLLLNEFLTAMSEVVERHGGVVDKYLGDGAMAIFGAPVTRPDDTQRALDCALAIRERIEGLAPRLESRGLPHPDIGIGLNTTVAIAGNIGSPTRLNYTVLGDGVNLASRLEGLTKRYHVPIVVGELTKERARGIVFRELDKVRVKGKRIPERIFEPLGRTEDISPMQLQLLARWHEALEDFRARRWVQALAAIDALADERHYVRLCAIYQGYLRELAAHPPGHDWDAAFTLYDK